MISQDTTGHGSGRMINPQLLSPVLDKFSNSLKVNSFAQGWIQQTETIPLETELLNYLDSSIYLQSWLRNAEKKITDVFSW